MSLLAGLNGTRIRASMRIQVEETGVNFKAS